MLVSTQFQGSLNVQSILTTSFNSLVPLNTRQVLNNITTNMVIKNVKNPYLKDLLLKKLGIFLFLDNFNLLPIRSNI